MSESFTAPAFTYVWNSLTPEQRQRVRDKAKWEHISVAAALKWMEPDAWSAVRELSDMCEFVAGDPA